MSKIVVIMKTFINNNFLLPDKYSKELYHGFAEGQPIIDYHNHLPPSEVAENYHFSDLSEIWLSGDHYKWRALRANGVSEHFVTGTATAEEKFSKWAQTVPYTLMNPLYHWTHLELLRYFEIDELLDASNAAAIFRTTREKLNSSGFGAHDLLTKMNVDWIGTTDDPADELIYHQQIKENPDRSVGVYASFRPDKAFKLDMGLDLYRDYLEKLQTVSGTSIKSFSDLLSALDKRHEAFHALGSRVSDHGLDQIPRFTEGLADSEQLFRRFMDGESLSPEEKQNIAFEGLAAVAEMNHKRAWVQQWHIGPLRNNNSKQFKVLGPDSGYDSINDISHAQALRELFNHLDAKDQLSKTIIYNINSSDLDVFATMIGNYQDGSVPGKIQLGSGWWFQDTISGMEKQLQSLSVHGLLSRFVGMLTDSRSFLSFPRHEYFRRVLCRFFGQAMLNGELPADVNWVGQHVKAIAYENANNYFGIKSHL